MNEVTITRFRNRIVSIEEQYKWKKKPMISHSDVYAPTRDSVCHPNLGPLPGSRPRQKPLFLLFLNN